MKNFIKTAGLSGALILLSGCAHHVLTVREPDVTGDPVTIHSNVFLGGKDTQVINGKEDDGKTSNPSHCDTNLLAAVEVKRDFGQALLSTLTLGAYSSLDLVYHCSNKPAPNIGPVN